MTIPTNRIESIELTEDEMSQLSLMCGYATGAAMQRGEKALADSFIKLTNAIHANRAGWVPYKVEGDQQ